GPPSPGSTPTKMPSTSPSIIRARFLKVSRTVKPWISRPKASMALVSERRLERPLRHDHVEGDLEGDEHRRREQERGEDRLPDGDAADEPHEAGGQDEAGRV